MLHSVSMFRIFNKSIPGVFIWDLRHHAKFDIHPILSLLIPDINDIVA